MKRPTHFPTPKRKFYPARPEREFRLRRGITLSEAARLAGLSLARASEIERFPDRARPGELERLRTAIDRAAEGSEESARPHPRGCSPSGRRPSCLLSGREPSDSGSRSVGSPLCAWGAPFVSRLRRSSGARTKAPDGNRGRDSRCVTALVTIALLAMKGLSRTKCHRSSSGESHRLRAHSMEAMSEAPVG